MKSYKKMGIVIVLIAITSTSCWKRSCPPCPGTNKDSCFCDPKKYTCCPDTISKSCDTNYDINCAGTKSDYANADICIDSLIVTQVADEVHTAIYIANYGDDNASCAKLNVQLPVAAKFIGIEFPGGPASWISRDWEFYRGYLRINLGDLANGTPDSKRHIIIKTSTNCISAVQSGIAAFVYDRVPDPCLANNYAYTYYYRDSTKNCPTSKVDIKLKQK